MKKKIGLFLGVEPYSGGAFQYCHSILEALNKLPVNEFSVVVAYTSASWENYLHKYSFKSFHTNNGHFWDIIEKIWLFSGLPVGILRHLYQQCHSGTKKIIGEQCDLWIFPSQDRWCYHIPVPALGTIHDLMHRYEDRFPEVAALGRGKRRDRHYRNICRWAKGVLVDSGVGKQQVIESYGLRPERIHVLPYIPPPHIYTKDVPQDFNLKYPLPEKFFFYPAQFWEHKNHRNLMIALSKLKSQLNDIKLVLAGSRKNAYEAVSKLVLELGLTDHVIFLGYVPDEYMPEIYRRACALIMPTFFGPTNIPPLEAFAAGCPVAISGIYGMPEQAGNAALLFDPNSVEEIAEVMHKLWTNNNLCKELQARGKKKSSEWGQEQFNKHLQNILFKVME